MLLSEFAHLVDENRSFEVELHSLLVNGTGTSFASRDESTKRPCFLAPGVKANKHTS